MLKKRGLFKFIFSLYLISNSGEDATPEMTKSRLENSETDTFKSGIINSSFLYYLPLCVILATFFLIIWASYNITSLNFIYLELVVGIIVFILFRHQAMVLQKNKNLYGNAKKEIDNLKLTERALKENERTFETLISNLPGVVYRCSNDLNWTMEFVSDGCLELTGYQSEDIIMNKNVSYVDLIHPEDRKMVWDTIQKALKEKEHFKITYKIITADSKEKHVWEQGKGIFSPEGDLIALEGFITDITKRKKAETDFKKSELYYRTIFENTGTATLIFGEDTVVSIANSEFEKLSGYLKEDMEGKKSWIDLIAEEDLEMVRNYHSLRKISPESVPQNYETKLINKKGDIKDVHVTVALIPNTKNRVVSFLDISERKKAEESLKESENRYRELLENSFDAVVIHDGNNVISANTVAMELLWIKSPEEFMNIPLIEFIHGEYHKTVMERVQKMLKDGGTLPPIEEKFLRADGTPIDVEVLATGFTYNGENAVQVVFRDISHRKKIEKDIKASLKEKELFLKEIHHQVKNNLQIISSLLDLQGNYVDNKETVNVLHGSKDRVKSMAMIHDMLYQSTDLAGIDFSNYIKNLVQDLFYSYGVKNNIKLIIDAEEIFLNIETAIPCGLIINELVSNSLKYAFPDNNSGEVSVRLHMHDKYLELIVADNGIGLSEDINFENIQTLGLRLVNMLINQLEGSLELERDGGTTFRIRFKELKYKKRF
ncbi:PAS domain S-box protein [Methanobacterium sp.]|jgi:PAS domain S-box-containing protein|uniref:PAS domain-containing sensor histidine kinase n=1 Tax=Methanobacterium sp. TaxID=2164 RepID=UPI00315952E3